MDACRCEVTWTNLELTTSDGKKIISNASGQIKPSTLMAVLGPSGSGKSSLLNSLAGRIGADQTLTGDIKVNGKNRDEESWVKTVAYVGQSFYSYPWQTVYETLEFAAKLRLENQKQINQRVNELIDLLGLSASHNTFMCKLSGGEKIRVGLGLELLGDPLVILVDEPLSGLDSFNAINILDILRKLANMGKTVMVTIHQPSYMMMSYFDSMMLICQGRCVFEGTLNRCIQFFEECGFELPKNTTPTDFFLNVLSIDHKNEEQRDSSLKKINMISREWNFIKPEYEMTIQDRIVTTPSKKVVSNFKALIIRNFMNNLRNVEYLKTRVMQKVFMALLFGLTFYNTGLENANIFSFRGIMTFTLQTELFGVSGPLMNSFIEEKKIISRECMSGMYRGYEAYLAKFITESIISLVYAVPYHSVVYYLIGFPFGLNVTPMFFLIISFIIFYSFSFGLTVSTIAGTAQAAQALGVTVNISFMLYSGIFSNPRSLPKYISWFSYISPGYYSFRALVINQLSNLPYRVSDAFDRVSNPQTIISFGLQGMSVMSSLAMLFTITACLQVLGAYLLHTKMNNNLKIRKLKTIDV